MLFKRKNIVKVEMADLDAEKTNLMDFLASKFNLKSSITSKGLELNADDIQTFALVRMVTKFLHHKNLSSTHWASIENNEVKINKFKVTNQKKEKHKKNTPHQTITQSWGL